MRSHLALCGRTPRSVCHVKELLTYVPSTRLRSLPRVSVLLSSRPADSLGGASTAPRPAGHSCSPPPRLYCWCRGAQGVAASMGCVDPSCAQPSGLSPALHV